MDNLSGYHDLLVESAALLLDYIFKKFRNTCLNLDSVQISSTRNKWDCK